MGKKWKQWQILFSSAPKSVQWQSVQLLIPVWLFVTPWIVAHQAFLSITNSRSLLKLMFIKSLMPANHLILCGPLLPSTFPSIRVFFNESVLPIRWPKYWSFSFSISPSNKYAGLISFRIDWFDFLAVQGTLKSLSDTTIPKVLIFFSTQLSYVAMKLKDTCSLEEKLWQTQTAY